MSREKIQNKLTDVIRDFFELPQLAVDPSTSAAQVEGWDSLAHVGLILAVEKAFAVRFTTKEVQSLRTVGDLIALLERRGM
jgi:acyl carrier protein